MTCPAGAEWDTWTLRANDIGRQEGKNVQHRAGRPRGSPLLWTGPESRFIRCIVGATLVVARHGAGGSLP